METCKRSPDYIINSKIKLPQDIETDLWGYYDKKLLESGYNKPLEWQYREAYPYEDNISNISEVNSEGWENVDNNYTDPIESKTKTPEEFKKEIEILREKYVKPNLWDNRK